MVFYKDFGKETKDVFTKNTAEGKSAPKVEVDGKKVPKAGQFNEVIWKVESKLKAAKAKPIVINPVADASSVSANVEFVVNQVQGLKGKMNVKPGVCAKPTFTYECCGRKVEATVDSFKGISGYEVTFEDKQKAYNLIAKVNEKAVSTEASVPVHGTTEAGASVSYALGTKKLSWAAGARYRCAETILSLTTAGASAFTFGAYIPVPGVKLEGKPVVTAFQADFNRASNAFDFVAGVSAQVPACPLNSSFKFKINKNLAMSISHFVELAGWKVATSFDAKEKKVGVVFTLE